MENNVTTIQGIQLEDIAKKYGTPLFIYDTDKMIHQYKKMDQVLKVEKKQINYACKALSNINILKIFKDLGAGLDTVSIQEIQLGLRAGFTPEKIIYTPNSVSIQEIEEAIQLGVRINIDNLDYLEYIGHHHAETPICIRFNPHIMAGGNQNISVGHIDSKFGISIHQLPLVERIVSNLDIKVEGVHMHTGSDILDIDVFLRAADILFDIAKSFEDVEYIDFGSGFKVKYKTEDIETDMDHFGREISARFESFCKEQGKSITLMFEPGKYLVSEAGLFLVKANLIKQTTSTVFACVDSGFNHMIRPMFYNAHHDIYNLSNTKGNPKIYTVVGYICETDTFGWNRIINEIKPGDLLVFKNAGAYCFSMASNYNSRHKPAEVMIYNGKDYLIRKRETMEDLLKTTVEVDLS